MNRRSLITGIVAGLAAPSIVRAEALMKIARLRVTPAPIEAYVSWDTGNMDTLTYWVVRDGKAMMVFTETINKVIPQNEVWA